MDGSVLLESGERVNVAVVQGDPWVLEKIRLEFVPPRWFDDASSSTCLYCQNKFTQIRRKHHCRSCGRIFCSRCCNDKMMLPQLGLKDPGRICLICKPIQELLTKAFSSDVSANKEAASSIHENVLHRKNMQEILELGCLQTLVWMCKNESSAVYPHVIASLHILATQAMLQPYLIQAGLITAFSRIIRRLNPVDKAVTDCISTLLILSSKVETAEAVIKDGGLSCLLPLLAKVDGLTRLLIFQTMVKVSILPSCHAIIMADMSIVRYMTSLIKQSHDIQIMTLIMKILSETTSQPIAPAASVVLGQEEMGSGYITCCIESNSSGELTLNTCCLLANLASEHDNQTFLSALVPKLVPLIEDTSSKHHPHVLRALANFSHYPQLTALLVPYIPLVLKSLNMAADDHTQKLAMLFTTNLLCSSTHEACQRMGSEHFNAFLTKLVQTNGVPSALKSALQENVYQRSRPV